MIELLRKSCQNSGDITLHEGIHSHQGGYFLVGAEDSGVLSSAKYSTNMLEGAIGLFPDKIYGNLACQGKLSVSFSAF